MAPPRAEDNGGKLSDLQRQAERNPYGQTFGGSTAGVRFASSEGKY
jgi:hypothetical protein